MTPDRQEAEVVLTQAQRNELLSLLDHVDSLVRFCSVSMPDVDRYYRGAAAMWAVVYTLVGDGEATEKNKAIIRKHGGQIVPPLHAKDRT